jgi:membrane-bound lytic murein transglycosylase D
MKLNRNLIVLAFALFFGAGQLYAQKGDSIVSFNDDPIAAMLDSLARLKYFEKGVVKPVTAKTSKFQFAPDSVPRYDDMVYESRLAKLDAQSPFDLVYNDAVKGYIELYAVRKRELVSRMMALSQYYFPMFEEVLDKYNLPLELKYLAICESALNPTAKSRAGAMGLWQFMYPTGKMYGLQVSSYVDERCDPYKATIAACEYMQFLYKMFGDWEMVLAAYNGGPGTVNRAIRRSGGKKTYWEIRPFLPRETQGYVPAFIAVNYVMNYAPEHNLYASVPKKTFFQVDTVQVRQQLSFQQLSAVLDIPVEDLQYMNPCYKKQVIPVNPNGKPYTLVLPSNKIGNFITNEVAIYNYLKEENPQPVVVEQASKTHVVRKGEHLSTIAKKYNCTISDLQSWNNLKSLKVYPGQKLSVFVSKTTQTTTGTVAANNNTQTAPKQNAPANTKTVADNSTAKAKYYTVRKGDTLWEIAKRNGITVEELKKMNGMGKTPKLMPGAKLKVGVQKG